MYRFFYNKCVECCPQNLEPYLTDCRSISMACFANVGFRVAKAKNRSEFVSPEESSEAPEELSELWLLWF